MCAVLYIRNDYVYTTKNNIQLILHICRYIKIFGKNFPLKMKRCVIYYLPFCYIYIDIYNIHIIKRTRFHMDLHPLVRTILHRPRRAATTQHTIQQQQQQKLFIFQLTK